MNVNLKAVAHGLDTGIHAGMTSLAEESCFIHHCWSSHSLGKGNAEYSRIV